MPLVHLISIYTEFPLPSYMCLVSTWVNRFYLSCLLRGAPERQGIHIIITKDNLIEGVTHNRNTSPLLRPKSSVCDRVLNPSTHRTRPGQDWSRHRNPFSELVKFRRPTTRRRFQLHFRRHNWRILRLSYLSLSPTLDTTTVWCS